MTGRKRTRKESSTQNSSPSSAQPTKRGKRKVQHVDVEAVPTPTSKKSPDYYDFLNRKIKQDDPEPPRFDLQLEEERIRKHISSIIDVTAKEKEMMMLWNMFMFEENKVAGYMTDPGLLLLRFAKSYGKVILDKDLYGEFLLHVANLNDFGLLGESADIQSVAMIVKSAGAGNDPTTAA